MSKEEMFQLEREALEDPFYKMPSMVTDYKMVWMPGN
jgi:hypothetical protein